MYAELKQSGQEAFKKKVLFKKIPNVISLLINNGEAGACIDLLKFHKKLFKEDKYEPSFVLFTAIDGEKTRSQLTPDQFKAIEPIAADLVESMLTKLEEFIATNQGKVDSSKCMKVLILGLKPLEEAIKICGPCSDQLPKNWRERTNAILKALSVIVPLKNNTKVTPPNTLIESYVQLTLLADKEYQISKPQKLKFETFYQLFVRVET